MLFFVRALVELGGLDLRSCCLEHDHQPRDFGFELLCVLLPSLPCDPGFVGSEVGGLASVFKMSVGMAFVFSTSFLRTVARSVTGPGSGPVPGVSKSTYASFQDVGVSSFA